MSPSSRPAICAWLLFLALFLAAGLALGDAARAAAPELVLDIMPGELPAGGAAQFVSLGRKVVFLGPDNDGRSAIWGSDGTAAGTEVLGVLCPPCGSANRLGATRTLAFFQAVSQLEDGRNLLHLWRTDGTREGTFPVVTGMILAPPFPQVPLSAVADTRVYFNACTAESGCEIWSSDGTAAGTGSVADLVPGPGSLVVREMVALGEDAWFLGRGPGGPSSGMALWHADARQHTVTRVRSLPDLPRPRLLTVAGGRLYFLAAADGLELWTSDGTAAGTHPVTQFRPADPFGRTYLKAIGGRVYFLADDGFTGTEIWSADARSAARVTDFAPAQPFAYPGEAAPLIFSDTLAEAGGRLIFSADNGHGVQPWTSRGRPRTTQPLTGCPGGCPVTTPFTSFTRLGGRVLFSGGDGAPWVSDGTGPGTRRLTAPPARDSFARAFAGAGDRVYFERYLEEREPAEVWVTDGTPAGTRFLSLGRITESHYLPSPRGPLDVGVLPGKVLYLGYDDENNTQLWESDGTRAAPLVVRTEGVGSSPARSSAFAGHLLFAACRQYQEELWTSGGTAASTLRLSDTPTGPCFSNAVSPAVAVSGGVAVFRVIRRGNDPMPSTQIWRTDGTPAGTYPLTTFGASDFPGEPMPWMPAGGTAVFSLSSSGFKPSSFWTTDGTREGTHELVQVPAGLSIWNEAAVGAQLFFLGTTDGRDVRVWRSDGTLAGTYALTTFNVLPSSTAYAFPRFTGLGGRIYFLPYVNDRGPELWSTDGTPAGTAAVAVEDGIADADGLEAAGGLLWFRARQAGSADRRKVLWRSDGTAAGTFALPAAGLPDEILTPPLSGRRFAALGSEVFFQASDPAHGGELWKSDGTREGTVLVRDIFPGLPDSHPLGLVAAGGAVWFAASDGVHGDEPWKSDGTPEGTVLVDDIAPGASWSGPAEPTLVGNTLFFAANDGEHGRELWKVQVP